MNRMMGQTRSYLERFEIGEAQREVYDFFWNEYCDWYIELAKVRIREGSSPSPLPVLAHVLEKTLRLLHPFMPFVTEEIWLRMKDRLPAEGDPSESIMIAPYPMEDLSKIDAEAEAEMSQLISPCAVNSQREGAAAHRRRTGAAGRC